MPTGYTAKLMEEGQTFPEFVMLCARAFGATILMRDEPLDKPIPRFEPSDYNVKALSAARLEYARLNDMGGSERIAFGEQKRAADIEARRKFLAKDKSENERLTAMRSQVLAWTPPSADHEKLKAFMLEQIEISKNSLSFAEGYLKEAEDKAPVHYYAEAVMRAQRDITYHVAEYEKELKSTEQRNRWVEQLRASIHTDQPA